MTWPPADTDRNRLVYTVAAVLGVLATVYFLLWALQTRSLVPWVGFTLLLAATLVAGVALLAMRERRAQVGGPDRPDAPTSAGPAGPPQA